MWHACMPIFVGVASLVSEILILFYSSLLLIMMQFYIFASCLMHAHYWLHVLDHIFFSFD